MKSHFSLPRRVTAACAVAGTTTMLNGNCSAQTLIAADYATNSTYAAGWSAGQNGGYGFGPWSMDYTSTSPVQNAMDGPSSPNASAFDPFGVAWTLYNPVAPVSPPYPRLGQPPGWPGGCANPPYSIAPTGDISRAGRAIPGGLQPGQTFSTVIANPTDRYFYKGYTIIFSNGGDNIQYGGAGSVLSVGTFEYFSYGRWYAAGANGADHGYTGTTLFDTDTSTNGMELDVTIVSTNGYYLVMTPLNNPANAFSESGTFATNEPITWITYQLYNTDSDFYPTNSAVAAGCGPNRTDFYIASMTIEGLLLNIQLVGTNAVLSWPSITGFTLASTLNLGTAAVWSTNLPPPVVVNGLSIVTNPIAGTRQFYRLQQ